MKKLAVLAALVWTGRWLALELASLVSNRIPRGAAPKDSPRRPGWMPGPNQNE
jgi:hypothetical protein